MTKSHHAPHGAGFRHGNRTRVDRTLSGPTVSDVATIAPASNRQTEIRDGDGVLSKSFALSTGGNMASQAVTGGPTYDYVYSPRGRLASLKIGGTEVAEPNASVRAIEVRGQRLPDQVLVFSGIEAPQKN